MNKVIIAGSRSITNYNLLLEAIKESKFNIDVVISGNAKGVDSLGERYAKEKNIELEIYPAKWNYYKNIPIEDYVENNRYIDITKLGILKNQYGRYYYSRAGLERNRDMIVKGKATHVIALIKDNSSGSKHMIGLAKEYKLNLFVKEIV